VPGLDDVDEDGEAVLAKVVDTLEAGFNGLVASFDDRVLARLDSRRPGLTAELQDAARRGMLAAMRDALARLRSQAALPAELGPDLARLASLWADSSCQLADLTDVQLVAHDVFWDRFSATAERVLDDPSLCWDVVKVARVRLNGYADHTNQLFHYAYERELTHVARMRDGSRWGAVARALEGRWVGAVELGYELGHSHVAMVADTPLLLEALACHAKRELLQVQAPGGGVWAWLGGPTPLPDDELDALIAWQRRREGEVAFGEPAGGLAGFSVSHRQAIEARAIAVATAERVVRFGDLHLLIALLRDRRLSQGFVERELGELAGPGERTRELRATLRAYLEHGQCVSTTAALLRRDRKTIQRQLQSAQELLRRCVSDRSGELLIALRTADIVGHVADTSSPPNPASGAGLPHNDPRRPSLAHIE
jgi:hypothetical protein